MSASLAQSAPPAGVMPAFADADEALWLQHRAMRRLVNRIMAANDAYRHLGQSFAAFTGPEGKRVVKRLDRVAADRAALLDAVIGVVPETLEGLRDKAAVALLAGTYNLMTEQDQRPAIIADEVLKGLLVLT